MDDNARILDVIFFFLVIFFAKISLSAWPLYAQR